MGTRIPKPVLDKMHRQAYAAYAAYADWLAYLRRTETPVAQDTLMLCERLGEMAEAIFVAGYTTALVDGARPAAPLRSPGSW